MPTYQSVCMTCGKYHEYIRTVAEMRNTPECCGAQTDKRLLTAPMARMDIQPWDAYESPATGKTITSYAQRREDMKASGCRDWEGRASEQRQSDRIKGYDEAAMDAKLETSARNAWASLSPEKKAAALAA